MEQLTPEQLDKVKQLRSALEDVVRSNHDDRTLFKWLKARKFDVQKSEAMYRKSMAWREETGADRILADYKIPEVMQRHYPGGLLGEDKDGRPVWIDPLGRADLKGIMYSVKKTDIVKTMVHRLETLYKVFDERTALLGRPIDQCVHIVDMEGFGSRFMWKPALDLYIEILAMLEKNYPETLFKTFIIKAPKIFLFGFNVIKKFIDKNTVSKFVVCDNRWKEEVEKVIDLNQLPEYYGGQAKDPDGNPRVETKVCYGGDVPKSFYRKKDEFFPVDLNPVTATLHRGGSLRLMYNVPNDSHVIRWIFATDSGEVEFGVFRDAIKNGPGTTPIHPGAAGSKVKLSKDELKEFEVVLPVNTYDVHRVPEDSMQICDTPGNYVLVFKNPNKILKRIITYCVEVVAVTEDNMLTDASPPTTVVQEMVDAS